MKISFFGAAKMVTGSNYLVEVNNYKILIDCGMFQGNEAIEKMNYDKFPYDPSDIDFLLLTHAHIDHSGRIPKLVKEGFKGRIIATNPTYELCQIMLLDSAKIQESDVKWENKKRERAGKPLLQPLYTTEDANHSLKYFEPYFLDQMIKLNDNIKLRFKDAGHILGSAIIEVWLTENDETTKIVFSGDLGVRGRLIINDPEYIDEADYLVIESTYGDRLHPSQVEGSKELLGIINKTAERGGTTLIPSFAVGRTQELIYELNKFYEDENTPEYLKIPIYVDSPMAVKATKVFERNASSFNEEATNKILSGDNPFEFKNLRYIETQEESMLLNKYDFPKVIISSSGMANAGRIRHHLKHNLWNEKNSLVFVGYQAEGTLGRLLRDGKKRIKLLGEEINVKLEVHDVNGFSGHADMDGLLKWVDGFKKKPSKIFIVHGEDNSAKNLSHEIEARFGTETIVPELGDSYEIESRGIEIYNKGKNMDETYAKNIEYQIDKMKQQLGAMQGKEGELLDKKLLSKDYDNINNRLIELNHMLMDLNMILGK